MFQFADARKALSDLFDRAVYLAKYLRQDIEWVWNLDLEDVALYEASVSKLLRLESGAPTTNAPGRFIPQQDPWGFSGFDG